MSHSFVGLALATIFTLRLQCILNSQVAKEKPAFLMLFPLSGYVDFFQK